MPDFNPGASDDGTVEPQGLVRWFDADQGIGRIIVPGGQDVFVDTAAVAGSGYEELLAGQVVQIDFDHETGRVDHLRLLDESVQLGTRNQKLVDGLLASFDVRLNKSGLPEIANLAMEGPPEGPPAGGGGDRPPPKR